MKFRWWATLALILSVAVPAAESRVVFPDLLAPEAIFVDGDRIYVKQDGVILAYDRGSGKKLFQLTAKGQGPGEFHNGSLVVTFLSGRIAVSGFGKVIYYKPNGERSGELKTRGDLRLLPLGANFAAEKDVFDPSLNAMLTSFVIFSPDFREIATLHHGRCESSVIIDSKSKQVKQKFFPLPHGFGCSGDGVHLCVYDALQKPFLQVFDGSGKRVSVPAVDFPRTRVSAACRESRLDSLKNGGHWESLNRMFDFVFPNYFPAFRRVYLRDGRLYILADTGKEEEQLLTVADFSGKILRQCLVPNVDYACFDAGTMFFFRENESDHWELQALKVL